jgi:3',5'-nucleoside bisphosphate phosphatase
MLTFADLHIHTYFSDSTLSPRDVIEKALQENISCVAITDHDTVDGVAPTQQAALSHSVEVISGIELSSEVNGQDVHILGYFLDCSSEALAIKLGLIQSVRKERINKMIDKLKGHGVDNITADEVAVLTKSDSVGRPHLALLLKEKGWVSSLQQAFDKYLAEGSCAYVKKFKQTPQEAIQLIREAKGVAVLAHPMVTKKDEMIPQLVDAGLQGLEAYYPNCSEGVIAYYKNLAKKYHLVLTGGSDAHGDGKMNTFIGKARVPYETVEQLRALSIHPGEKKNE